MDQDGRRVGAGKVAEDEAEGAVGHGAREENAVVDLNEPLF